MNNKVCKVTFSLASIQRPGHWAHNRKMTHWGLLSLPSTTGMGQVKDSRMIFHSVGLSCSTFTFRVWIPCLQILSGMAFLNASPCRRTLEGQFANRHFFGVSLYSKRLETELKTKLQIKKQHFLYLLSVITASRESLPVGFVSKVLVPGTNSKTAKRKVRRALGSVSTLLPIHDDCTSFHSQVS